MNRRVLGSVFQRTLFLDIDGVLHPETPPPGLQYESAGDPAVSPFCWLPTLVRLLAPHPEVAIVVHSSWRLRMPNAALLEHLALLAHHPIAVADPEIDDRRVAIQVEVRRRRIVDYRVLDDASPRFISGMTQLIVCPPDRGVSDAGVRSALVRWLGAPSSANPQA